MKLTLRLTAPLVFAIPSVGHTALIGLDRDVFKALVNQVVISEETFDSLPAGTVLNDTPEVRYGASQGDVVVTDRFLASTPPNGIGSTSVGFFNPGESATFSFANPITAFGIDINTFATQDGAYSAQLNTGETVSSFFAVFPQASTGQFLGFVSDAPFSGVSISTNTSFSYTLDTLTFGDLAEQDTPSPTDVRVFPSPYDGEISGRSFGGVESTFGYSFDGPNMYAEYLVRSNNTLEDLFNITGFESINWMQIVTDYPNGLGCLSGTNTPFLDPPAGGCILPNIDADNMPFYYDVGDEWVGTEYFVDDYILQGVQTSSGTSSVVDVGISFFDTPFSPFATEDSPMVFDLFPVGVRTDGTWETLVTESLRWSSTNNFFGGGVDVGRSNPINADFRGIDLLDAEFRSLNDLTKEQSALLLASNGIVQVPEPPTIFILISGLSAICLWRRRKSNKANVCSS